MREKHFCSISATGQTFRRTSSYRKPRSRTSSTAAVTQNNAARARFVCSCDESTPFALVVLVFLRVYWKRSKKEKILWMSKHLLCKNYSNIKRRHTLYSLLYLKRFFTWNTRFWKLPPSVVRKSYCVSPHVWWSALCSSKLAFIEIFSKRNRCHHAVCVSEDPLLPQK